MKTEIAIKQNNAETISSTPDNWNFGCIKDLVRVKAGYAIKSSDFTDSGVGVIKIKNIGNRIVDIENTDKISLESFNKLASDFILSTGDIVVAMTGATIGKVGKIKSTNQKYALNQRVARFISENKHDLEFVFQYSDTKDFIDAINNYANGAAQQNISADDIASIQILIPPTNERRIISEILSSIDDKIELNRQINLNLEKLAQILFKELFVNKIEDGIPDGWSIGKFGQIAENFDSKRIPLSGREREKRHGQYPYYGATSIMDFVDDFIFDGTYVLLGEDGSVAKEDGKPFVQYVSGKFWANNHAHVLQGKNGFTTEYIKVFLDQVDILPFVTGAVQPKINQANMNSIPVVIPDKKTLNDFNRVVFDFFRVISINEKQTQTLKVLKDSLLPKLMNGKIRVN